MESNRLILYFTAEKDQRDRETPAAGRPALVRMSLPRRVLRADRPGRKNRPLVGAVPIRVLDRPLGPGGAMTT
jgi:hypothetical protein